MPPLNIGSEKVFYSTKGKKLDVFRDAAADKGIGTDPDAYRALSRQS